MNSTADKLTGKTNTLAGKLRPEIGKAVGNREMQTRGSIQEAKGTAQQAKGRLKSTFKAIIDKV